jgi:hypothetical protein
METADDLKPEIIPSKQQQEKLSEKKPAVEEHTSSEPEKPFDFGGLPVNDLKKNLGCG